MALQISGGSTGSTVTSVMLHKVTASKSEGIKGIKVTSDMLHRAAASEN